MHNDAGGSIVGAVKDRCYFVYALAPAGVSARRANELLNEYIGDRSRGVIVTHDHFVGRHGGFAVFHVRTDDELAKLDDPGPLEGWRLDVHPLTFSLTGVGFVAQVDFTLENYAGTTLADLSDAEPRDRRYWWQAA
jgi:hypothetical protein